MKDELQKLTVLVMREGEMWSAGVLDTSLAAQGATPQEALTELVVTMNADEAIRRELPDTVGHVQASDAEWRLAAARTQEEIKEAKAAVDEELADFCRAFWAGTEDVYSGDE